MIAKSLYSALPGFEARMGRGWGMAVHGLFEKGALGPGEIAVLSQAYETVLKELQLASRDDAMTQMVARRVIQFFQKGVRNPETIARRVVESFSSK